jgi:phage/plasmid-associated DNA primase
MARAPKLTVVTGDAAAGFEQLAPAPSLRIGSLNEVADCVADEIVYELGGAVDLDGDEEIVAPFVEGQLWRWAGEIGCWQPQELLPVARPMVKRYDGATFETARGEPARVLLCEKKINTALLGVARNLTADKSWFDAGSTGINCRSGFIEFDPELGARLTESKPSHRARFRIEASYDPDRPAGIDGSLLNTLLNGCFLTDPAAGEKAIALQELAGAIALGFGPGRGLHQPPIFIFKGEQAGNGKSEWLKLFKGLLPPAQIACTPPDKWADAYYLVELAGKSLNVTDELADVAIAAREYKMITFGDQVQGRRPHQPVIDFNARALHIFATNHPPRFIGGVDEGTLRRTRMIEFGRVIPRDEQIPDIVARIFAEEPDILLAWAVEGARRVVAQGGFSRLPMIQAATDEWAGEVDLVRTWLARADSLGSSPVGAAALYDKFSAWAQSEGHADRFGQVDISCAQFGRKLGAIRGITKRRASNGYVYQRAAV